MCIRDRFRESFTGMKNHIKVTRLKEEHFGELMSLVKPTSETQSNFLVYVIETTLLFLDHTPCLQRAYEGGLFQTLYNFLRRINLADQVRLTLLRSIAFFCRYEDFLVIISTSKLEVGLGTVLLQCMERFLAAVTILVENIKGEQAHAEEQLKPIAAKEEGGQPLSNDTSKEKLETAQKQINVAYVGMLEEGAIQSLNILGQLVSKNKLMDALPIEKFITVLTKLLKRRRFVKPEVKLLALSCLSAILRSEKNQEYFSASEGLQLLIDLAKNKRSPSLEINKMALEVLRGLSLRESILAQLKDISEIESLLNLRPKQHLRRFTKRSLPPPPGPPPEEQSLHETTVSREEDRLVPINIKRNRTIDASPRPGQARSVSNRRERPMRVLKPGNMNAQAHVVYQIYTGNNFFARENAQNKSFV
eukprot:TRINITY_DN14619_c0_g1_i1.p1 TRINITY_DN14619_c0_g1~~TRINITY_DN14619_c0_g1_i1.p1  ORF type:complete len:438 (-),score=118.01 TRINITY_DN14619_c0_g1_i1:84-1340(-)